MQVGQRHSERAELAQAANVLRFDANGWVGRQHRWRGTDRRHRSNAGVRLAGLRVLLIGAGVPPPA